RFAAARRSDQRHHRTFWDAEGYVEQRLLGPVPERKPAHQELRPRPRLVEGLAAVHRPFGDDGGVGESGHASASRRASRREILRECRRILCTLYVFLMNVAWSFENSEKPASS